MMAFVDNADIFTSNGKLTAPIRFDQAILTPSLGTLTDSSAGFGLSELLAHAVKKAAAKTPIKNRKTDLLLRRTATKKATVKALLIITF
jgi:hypothetical protein